jgi:hypothetical protein
VYYITRWTIQKIDLGLYRSFSVPCTPSSKKQIMLLTSARSLKNTKTLFCYKIFIKHSKSIFLWNCILIQIYTRIISKYLKLICREQFNQILEWLASGNPKTPTIFVCNTAGTENVAKEYANTRMTQWSNHYVNIIKTNGIIRHSEFLRPLFVAGTQMAH